MSLLRVFVPGLLAAAFLFSPASALPGASSAKNLISAVEPAVIQVKQQNQKQGHGKQHSQKNVQAKHHNQKHVVKKQVVVKRVVYRPGARYAVAPYGWRAYGAGRPVYWQTQGCVLVGLLWYCP